MIKYALFCFLSFCSLTASERIYLDDDAIDHTERCFHLHVGDNVWLETETIHRDETGLYALEKQLLRDAKKEYKKKWKCPYCYMYWPIGQACQNPDCPSKYK